jgi:tetratricopeptide (TPR) repeat protein
VRAGAAEVAGASLPQLATLANKSLVERTHAGRYQLHEFVRQYAAAQLIASGERDGVARRHAAHFFALLEAAEPHMKGPDESAWMDRLELEHDNLLAALDRTVEAGNAEAASRACEVLRWFWYIRGRFGDGLRWTERTLALADAHAAEIPPGRRGKLLHGAGIFADEQGDYTLAAVRYAQALAVYRASGDQRGIQATTNSLGMLEWAQGRYASAQACFEECLRICRKLGHAWGVANSLNSLGTAIHAQGEPRRARACLEEALAAARDVGYEQLVTLVLDNIGEVSRALGDHEGARDAYTEALAVQRALGDTRGAALSLQGLGLCALARGDIAEAASGIYEGLRLSWQTANRRELTSYVDNLAALLAADGRFERAARLCGATDAYRARMGSPLTAFERASFERTVETARAGLGHAAFQAARAAGAAAHLDELIAEALEDAPGNQAGKCDTPTAARRR